MKFSLRQILASAAGAVLAAVIASAFGVKGTIIGVAIGSAAATTGTALVAQSIDRGHKAVKQVVVRSPETTALLRKLGATGASGGSDASVDAASAPAETQGTSGGSDDTLQMHSAPASVEETQRVEAPAGAEAPRTEYMRTATVPTPASRSTYTRPRRFTWKAIAGTAAVVFVLALLFITAVELIAGKPLSSIFGHAGTGTSVNNIFGPSQSPAPSPTTTTSTTTSTTSPTTTSTTLPTSTSTTSSTGSSTTTTTGGPGASTTTTTGLGATTTTTKTSVSVPLP
jgi:hypothetical protein